MQGTVTEWRTENGIIRKEILQYGVSAQRDYWELRGDHGPVTDPGTKPVQSLGQGVSKSWILDACDISAVVDSLWYLIL